MVDSKLRVAILSSPFGTQERFAEAVGIPEAIVSKYCRGIRKPSQKHMEIIKKHLFETKGKTKEMKQNV